MNADYSELNLRRLVGESSSYRAVLKKLGKNAGGGYWHWLRRKIDKYGIDVSHFACNQPLGRKNKRKTANEILVEGKEQRERPYQLRRALLDIGRPMSAQSVV